MQLAHGAIPPGRDTENARLEAVARAYRLAESGQCPDLETIVRTMTLEGHVNVLTALRSRLVRRELRELCRLRASPFQIAAHR